MDACITGTLATFTGLRGACLGTKVENDRSLMIIEGKTYALRSDSGAGRARSPSRVVR